MPVASIDHIDLPIYVRNKPSSRPAAAAHASRPAGANSADLDVPTFLRRQAD